MYTLLLSGQRRETLVAWDVEENDETRKIEREKKEERGRKEEKRLLLLGNPSLKW